MNLLNQTNKPAYRIAGFLLFEVIVAVMIISVVLTLITRGFSSSLRSVRTSDNMLTASLLGEEMLGQLESELKRSQDSSILNDQGRYSTPFEQFAWSSRSEELDELPLQWVQFMVTWNEDDRSEWIEWNTYFFHKVEELDEIQ
jgi:type II secretory pathway pseudopilin PulG